MFRASASTSLSKLLGRRVSVAVWKNVKTGPNWTWTPFLLKAGAMKAPMSNWMSDFGGAAASAIRCGAHASLSRSAI